VIQAGRRGCPPRRSWTSSETEASLEGEGFEPEHLSTATTTELVPASG
jgi:hypothetical protein